uniref:Uncharacterized protein n=1 Tax=Anguilla anguilla TaxID=7936 RepID=A0A0E9RRU1_ANGAN
MSIGETLLSGITPELHRLRRGCLGSQNLRVIPSKQIKN